MSLTTTSARYQYAGNSIATAFAFPEPFLANADLKVVFTVAGVDTVQTTGFTITGVLLAGGGTVTFSVAPPTGTTVTIYRDPAQTQLIQYVTEDDFPAASHERSLDLLTMHVQALALKIKRALRLPITSVEGGELSLSARISKLLGFDSNGNPTFTDPLTLIPSDPSVAAGIAAEAALRSAADAAETARAIAAEGVLTASLGAGPGFFQNYDGTYIYDDFATDADNTVLNGKAAKGNKAGGAVWNVGGLGNLTTVVYKGAIKAISNSYCSINYGGIVNRVAGAFKYDSITGAGPSAIIIQNGTSLSHMVHLFFNNKGCTLTKVTAAGGGGVFVGIELFAPNGMSTGSSVGWDLLSDGTLYSIAIELNHVAQTITIVAPDGRRFVTAANADAFSQTLDTGTWQNNGWVGVEMSKRSQAASLVQLGHGVHKAELTALRGQIGAYRHPGIKFPITTVGWYRIANSSAGYRAFSIFGKFNICGLTNAYNSISEFIVGASNEGTTIGASGIILNYHQGTGGVSPVITQARISWLAGTSCALDVYVARNDGTGFVTVDFEGVGNLVDFPVVGAVAQATGNTVYTIPVDCLNRASNEPCAFSRLSLGGFGSYSAVGSVDLRPNVNSNRMAFHSMIGGGNFTGSHAWGLNSVVSDTDAVTKMTLGGNGLLVGGSAGAGAPFHALTTTDTTAAQNGLWLAGSPGSGGGSMPSVDWVQSALGTMATIQGYREGASFATSLHFFTRQAGGTLAQPVTINSAGDVVVGKVTGTGVRYGNGGPLDLAGSGTPEGAVTAPIGSMFRRTDGGAGTTLYVKESGAGNTGWIGKSNLYASPTLDFPSITANGGVQDLTATVTGATTANTAVVNFVGTPPSGIIFTAWVSATNTVTVRATNCTTGAIDPASATYRIVVLT